MSLFKARDITGCGLRIWYLLLACCVNRTLISSRLVYNLQIGLHPGNDTAMTLHCLTNIITDSLSVLIVYYYRTYDACSYNAVIYRDLYDAHIIEVWIAHITCAVYALILALEVLILALDILITLIGNNRTRRQDERESLLNRFYSRYNL